MAAVLVAFPKFSSAVRFASSSLSAGREEHIIRWIYGWSEGAEILAKINQSLLQLARENMPSFHFRAEAHFPHGKHTTSRPIYLQTEKKESTLIILFFISLSSCLPSNPPKSNYHLISVGTLFSFSCFHPFLFPHYSYHLFSSPPPAFEGRGRCWQ